MIHNPSLFCLLLIESLIACLTLVVFKPRLPDAPLSNLSLISSINSVMVSGCADPNSFNNDNVNQLFSTIVSLIIAKFLVILVRILFSLCLFLRMLTRNLLSTSDAVQGGRLCIAAPDAATLKALPCANSDVRQIFNAVPV